MPFVVVDRSCNSWDVVKIENLCKEAWVAMNQGESNTLKDTDVGGVVVASELPPGSLHVKFFYCNRGTDFSLKLYRILKQKFGDHRVIVYPTQSDDWFADPVWAVVDVKGKDSNNS